MNLDRESNARDIFLARCAFRTSMHWKSGKAIILPSCSSYGVGNLAASFSSPCNLVLESLPLFQQQQLLSVS